MAKLMAPNIRIDWYPDGHFQDIHNPTVDELNSGVNLSCAVVSGFTLDFADPDTVQITGILNDTISQVVNRSVYEANLQFFLAPRGSNSKNERAFRDAERLFYNQHNNIGYLVKRVGYLSHVEYGETNDQHIDIFKVQADVPKVLSEDGEPILLDVQFIPQGEAASAVISPWSPARDEYIWLGSPGFAESWYFDSEGIQTKRNIFPDPSFEYSSVSDLNLSSNSNSFSYEIVDSNALYGGKALEATVTGPGNSSTKQQIEFIVDNPKSLDGKWIGYSFNAKSGASVFSNVNLFVDSKRELREERVLDSEYRNIRSGAVRMPNGAQRLRLVIFNYGKWASLPIPNGEKIYIDGVNFVVGDSEESVLYQLETYFDGNGSQELPEAAQDYTTVELPHSWEGEPNFSPSKLEEDGVLLARNLVPNPTFRESVRGWELIDDGGRDFYPYGWSGSPSGVIGSSTTSTFVTVQNTNEGMPQIPVGTGWLAGRFGWRSNRWNTGNNVFSVRIELLDSNYNSVANYLVYESTSIPEGTYSWAVPTVPNATQVRMILHTKALSGYLHNIGGSISYVMVAAGETFKEAAEQVKYFFDGEELRTSPVIVLEKPGTQYAWLGEPHNSPSVKIVDGEIVAQNIIPDPRLLQEGSTASTANTVVGRAPRDGMFPELGNKIGDDVFYFGSVENPASAVYASSGLQNSPYLEKDKWYAGSIWVHTIDHMTPNPDRFNMQFRNAANPTWGSSVAEVHPSGMKRIVVSGKVEADNPQTWWVFWPYELRNYIGEYVYVGALQLSGPSDTEQEALQQVETYFDGDTV